MIVTQTRPVATQPVRRTFNGTRPPRSFAWIAAAFMPLFIAAGVTILVETKKGKLIIESDSAGVNVTLLKDGEVYDELKIQAGVNSVTLLAGKYQVVIDGAADVVMDGDRIEVKRGEVVLAKIRTETTNNEPQAVEKSAVAKVEKVYRGKPLSEWLDALEREEHVESFRDALDALSSLRSAENAASITELLLKRLPGLKDSFAWSSKLLRQGTEKQPDQFSNSIDTSAFVLLRNLNAGDGYFRLLADELAKGKLKWQTRILNVGLTIGGTPSEREIAPIVEWIEGKVLVDGSDQATLLMCAEFCWTRINDSQASEVVLKDRLLADLIKTKALGSDFWIDVRRVAGTQSFRTNPDFSAAKQEVERRAIEAFSDPRTETKYQLQAAMVLQRMYAEDFDRSGLKDSREDVLLLIRQHLRRLLANPTDMFVVTPVEGNVRNGIIKYGYLKPSGEVRGFGQWSSGQSKSNIVFELLALIHAMKAQAEFAPELVKLYMATAELNEQLHEIVDSIPNLYVNYEDFVTQPRISATLEQFIAGMIRLSAYQLLPKETQTELLQIAQRTFQTSAFESLLAEHDANGDGKLTIKEADTFSLPIAPFDADQSGTIDAEEFASFTKRYGPNNVEVKRPVQAGVVINEEIAKRVIERYDSNKDGKITKEEWSKMPFKVDGADSNNDGEITVEEFVNFRNKR